MTITLPQELEETITERAHQQGITPSDMAVELLQRSLGLDSDSGSMPSSNAHQETLTAIQNGRYARFQQPNTLLAADRFAADKAAERAREERRWRA